MGWWNKGCKNGPDHMTKLAAEPIYGKNLLLQSQKCYDRETWQALQSLRKL